MTKQVLDRLRNPPAPDPKLAALTDTERKVLDLIGQGLTNRQIADQIHLADCPPVASCGGRGYFLGPTIDVSPGLMVSIKSGTRHAHLAHHRVRGQPMTR